jgi:hypothetical protein
VRGEKRLHPLDGVDVEVVGGLVEQQHVGRAHKGARQQRLAGASARGLLDARLGIKREVLEYGLHAQMELPTVGRVHRLVQAIELAQGTVVGVRRQRVTGVMVARQQRAQLTESAGRHIENAAVELLGDVLLQPRHAHRALAHHAPLIGRHGAIEHLQQCALAGAVATEQAHAVAASDREVGAIEHGRAAKGHRDVLQGEQRHRVRGYGTEHTGAPGGRHTRPPSRGGPPARYREGMPRRCAHSSWLTALGGLAAFALLGSAAPLHAQSVRAPAVAPSLAPLSDARFAELVAELSEPGGFFDTDNLISNERSYLHALSALDRVGVRGGAYIGVGPDQSFSYIAHTRSELAFLLDVRRDNLLQHLLFKVLFAQAPNRAVYLALWLGRPLPDGVAQWAAAPLDDILQYMTDTPVTPASRAAAHEAVRSALRSVRVPLSAERSGHDRALSRELHQCRPVPALHHLRAAAPPILSHAR